jgi:hypothetical protein
MRFIQTKMFATLMGIVCLSGVVVYLCVAYLITSPAHAAPVQGGGCLLSYSRLVAACISIDGNGNLVADAHIYGSHCTDATVTLMQSTSTEPLGYAQGCNYYIVVAGTYHPTSPGEYWTEAKIMFGTCPNPYPECQPENVHSPSQHT